VAIADPAISGSGFDLTLPRLSVTVFEILLDMPYPSPTPSPTLTLTPTPVPGAGAGEGSASLSPAAAFAGDLNTAVTLVYTSGATAFSGGFITVQIPAGMTQAQTGDPSQPGYLKIDSPGTLGQPQLFGTLVTLPVTSLAAGQSITLVFGSMNTQGQGGVTLPEAPGSYTFMVSSAPQGGLPLPLAAQPQMMLDAFVDGPLHITQALAAPNPVQGPGAVAMLELAGAADEVRIRIYTPAMTLAAEFSGGPFRPGWARVALPEDIYTSLNSGLYYLRLEARRGKTVSRPVLLKLMLLK
jgi:hypothetical protein